MAREKVTLASHLVPIEAELEDYRNGRAPEAITAYRERLGLSVFEAKDFFTTFVDNHILPGSSCDRCGQKLDSKVFGYNEKRDKRGLPIYDYYQPPPEPHDRDDCIRNLVKRIRNIEDKLSRLGEED